MSTSFGTLCPARVVGYKALGTDLDTSADIARTQLAAATDYIWVPLIQYTGALTNSGVFPALTFDDAAQKYGRGTIQLPQGYGSGIVSIVIPWYTAATTGNCKWIVDVASIAAAAALTSENQQTVVTAANGTGTRLILSTVSFTASYFASGDLIGVQVSRDGADVLDTISADAFIAGCGVYLSLAMRG